ncbi:MAG: Lrp/AsnC family transcriptional regulator [Candidatus Thorarchaeota archaeon]|nr:Lrp/AsnC family transcriptional regulator [Candidatus Bathyarchaeota archaeon]TET06311.1 MAG: Lrp/AsnC family transcriptional regulator [Candidatus Thorarchaeota archaeon]
MPKSDRLDDLDCAILRELQNDCRTPLQEVAEKVGAPTSTVHYRVKRLEREGVIDGYYARINPEKFGMDYITVIKVQASYGPGFGDRIGKRISKLPGVWAVYFTLGETDFFVLTRSKNRDEYMKILETLMSTKGILRTSTQVVAKVIREDPRLDIQ